MTDPRPAEAVTNGAVQAVEGELPLAGPPGFLDGPRSTLICRNRTSKVVLFQIHAGKKPRLLEIPGVGAGIEAGGAGGITASRSRP